MVEEGPDAADGAGADPRAVQRAGGGVRGCIGSEGSVSATSYRHSCRACLGQGCIHCGNNGTVRERVFRRPDAEAVRLRALLLVDRPAGRVVDKVVDEARRAILI